MVLLSYVMLLDGDYQLVLPNLNNNRGYGIDILYYFFQSVAVASSARLD
jgi:hypothetical protein